MILHFYLKSHAYIYIYIYIYIHTDPLNSPGFLCFLNDSVASSAAQDARRGGEHQKAGDGLGADQLVVAASVSSFLDWSWDGLNGRILK